MEQEKISNLDKLIDTNNFSGVISIREKNNIIYEKAYGYRNISEKLEIDMDTKFGLASGAKTYTAIAIMKLHEENKLNINDFINKYLKETSLQYHEDITIKHLLSHTSGIPDYLDEEKELDLTNIKWDNLLKPEDYFPYFPNLEADFLPGEKFKYNNGAYIILAYIIDLITGNYHQYVHEILEEVGINNTKYYMFNQLPFNTAQGYIHLENNNYMTNIYLLPIIGGGDGGIFSSVNDIYTLWKKLFDYKIISKESLELLIKPHIKVEDNVFYGLGVWINISENTYKVKMIGQDHGVSYCSSYNVNTKEIITVISNNDKDAWKAMEIINQEETI